MRGSTTNLKLSRIIVFSKMYEKYQMKSLGTN